MTKLHFVMQNPRFFTLVLFLSSLIAQTKNQPRLFLESTTLRAVQPGAHAWLLCISTRFRGTLNQTMGFSA